MDRLMDLKEKALDLIDQYGWKTAVVGGLASLFLLNKLRKSIGLVQKKSLENEIVFITGAGSGIGKLTAIRLALLGAKVSIADINLQAAQSVVQEIQKLGKQAFAVHCDVSSYESVKQAVEQTREAYGSPTILVNNAGIVHGKPFLESNVQAMEKVVQVNLISNFYTVKEILPDMIAKNKGHIVTIASLAGVLGNSYMTEYCASKFGQYGFTEALRVEMKFFNYSKFQLDINMTTVCPAYIDTGMFSGVNLSGQILFPLQKENYVADRIVYAIQTNQEEVFIPRFGGYLIFVLRAIFPTWFLDNTGRILGAHRSMSSFDGRRVE